MSGHSPLAGKTALITGAGRGIGRAIAVELARCGARLFLTARSRQALAETADRAREVSAGAQTEIYTADLMEEEAPREIVGELDRRFGALDILVSNAGAALKKNLEHTSRAEWDAIMRLNARAPFFLFQAALPLLRRSQAASVVVVSSVVGRVGYAGQAAYSASKHALSGFTKAFAREVQTDGIRVHLVSPGGVATEMIRAVRPDIDESQLIAPEEVARAVAFLVTQRGNGVIDEINLRRSVGAPWG